MVYTGEIVLSGLIKKRAAISGEIEHAQTMLRQLIIDLDNIDATIRLFDPEAKLDDIKPKPFPPRHAAYRGEVSRTILSALRQSNGPLTAAQLAQMLMAERGMNTADRRNVKLIGKRVGSSLRTMRASGLVRSIDPEKRGQFLLWELCPQDRSNID